MLFMTVLLPIAVAHLMLCCQRGLSILPPVNCVCQAGSDILL